MKAIIDIIFSLFKANKNNSALYEEINMLKCEKLFWAIGMVVSAPVYIRNSIGRGTTYCNIAAYDLFDSRSTLVWNVNVQTGESVKRKYPMGNIIKAYDYDLGKVLPEDSYQKILSAPIPFVFDECKSESEKGNVRLLTQMEAQEKANKGIPIMIISKEFNHVAIACPNLKWNDDLGKMELFPYNEGKGCFTGNAGWENDYMYMSDKRGFGSLNWKSEKDILYAQFKLINTGKFDD